MSTPCWPWDNCTKKGDCDEASSRLKHIEPPERFVSLQNMRTLHLTWLPQASFSDTYHLVRFWIYETWLWPRGDKCNSTSKPLLVLSKSDLEKHLKADDHHASPDFVETRQYWKNLLSIPSSVHMSRQNHPKFIHPQVVCQTSMSGYLLHMKKQIKSYQNLSI